MDSLSCGNVSEQKSHLASLLRKSWYRLRLSVRDPERVPTWDAIVLTATSPKQVQLYEWHLQRSVRLGRISPSTAILAIPDPNGHRIGSGAATLNAICKLASYYQSIQHSQESERLRVEDNCSISHVSSEGCQPGDSVSTLCNFIKDKHVLLIHAGGDSKRVPWANPMGKAFLPLPYLASDDPDRPVPLLLDHILAIASCARQALKNQGGIMIMTGDVLPCFDASKLIIPDDASCIVTVPITIDIAANHGVIVASKPLFDNENLCLVDNLLQKPNFSELAANGAILEDGRTLLDTGVVAARGEAWSKLAYIACSSQLMILDLIESKKEISLYEELVAAWVPKKHDWLRTRPLGEELVKNLGKEKMFSYCSHDLLFLHFGTSGEVLDHICGASPELVERRHLCFIPASVACDIASSAVIISSKVDSNVSVGEDSLIYQSSIFGRAQIGASCIVVNMKNLPRDIGGKRTWFVLPDRHCIWEVPLAGDKGIFVYCGVNDNPKSSFSNNGTFCGRPLKKVLEDMNIEEGDIWDEDGLGEKCLWNARIFPLMSYSDMLRSTSWLMGVGVPNSNEVRQQWRRSPRLSLEMIHKSTDFFQMISESCSLNAELSAGIAKACISYGLLGRNFAHLCEEILLFKSCGITICLDLHNDCLMFLEQASANIPKSRVYQVLADLLAASGNHTEASQLEHKIWSAVADETASAVQFGASEHPESSATEAALEYQSFLIDDQRFLRSDKRIKVELPVRVDFAGGWSDTPPWSLERVGCVLNMAIKLQGSLPIGAAIATTKETTIDLSDDAGNHALLDKNSISAPFAGDDPFRLVKSALLVTEILHKVPLGLQIKTWARVPRGSGLGTSSILAAAVVKGLLQLSDGDSSDDNVAKLVLVLEQLMGAGGGWQDQIGGLFPGIKFTTSYPERPLRLLVTPLMASPQLITELQQRLLVVFTGQVRVAQEVLSKVVRRYLRRDRVVLWSIKRLMELAKSAREALAGSGLSEVGNVMLEAWRIHQELDPYCSNRFVDSLFAFADPYCSGYKLVGAGGGGFALLLAKDGNAANALTSMLQVSSEFPVQVYDWDLCL